MDLTFVRMNVIQQLSLEDKFVKLIILVYNEKNSFNIHRLAKRVGFDDIKKIQNELYFIKKYFSIESSGKILSEYKRVKSLLEPMIDLIIFRYNLEIILDEIKR